MTAARDVAFGFGEGVLAFFFVRNCGTGSRTMGPFGCAGAVVDCALRCASALRFAVLIVFSGGASNMASAAR